MSLTVEQLKSLQKELNVSLCELYGACIKVGISVGAEREDPFKCPDEACTEADTAPVGEVN